MTNVKRTKIYIFSSKCCADTWSNATHARSFCEISKEWNEELLTVLHFLFVTSKLKHLYLN